MVHSPPEIAMGVDELSPAYGSRTRQTQPSEALRSAIRFHQLAGRTLVFGRVQSRGGQLVESDEVAQAIRRLEE